MFVFVLITWHFYVMFWIFYLIYLNFVLKFLWVFTKGKLFDDRCFIDFVWSSLLKNSMWIKKIFIKSNQHLKMLSQNALFHTFKRLKLNNLKDIIFYKDINFVVG